MRPEKLYLTDIVEAADAIRRFVTEIDRDGFLRDELRQSAVLQKLIVIGEAAARLSLLSSKKAIRASSGATSLPSATSPFTSTSPSSGTSFG
jgi:uncharacterized protein with HEPN domain